MINYVGDIPSQYLIEFNSIEDDTIDLNLCKFLSRVFFLRFVLD